MCGLQIEQLQSQCCQLEKELARRQGDADVFKREAENKLAERMRVALREQQLEYESQVCFVQIHLMHSLPYSVFSRCQVHTGLRTLK